MPSLFKVDQLLQWGRQTLKQANIERGWVDARLLLAYALKLTIEDFMSSFDKPVTAEEAFLYVKYIHRRQHHEPVSRIIRYREFWSLSFEISPATLDPRPESELLVETILKDYPQRDQNLKILDLGTGSGCLLLSLLYEYTYAYGFGVDISLPALKVAQKNAENLRLQNQTSWLQGCWTHGLKGTFDIIVSNPPYIPLKQITNLSWDVKLYDPLKALDGGEDGLQCYQQLADQLKPFCHRHTRIYFEIGQNQEGEVTRIMAEKGFQIKAWHPDLLGIIRCGIFTVLS